jgi:hypothetical protein
VSPKRARNTGCAALWRIFSSNKSVPANRKKGFFGSRLPKNEEIKGTVPLTNQVCLCPHPIYVYSALSPIYLCRSFNINLPVCVGVDLEYFVCALPGQVGMEPGLGLVYGGLGLCEPVPHGCRHAPSDKHNKIILF